MTTLISFTIDNLGDAADLHRGVISAPRTPGTNPPLEQGYPALLELFGKHAIPLTCFVEGWSAREYPERLQHLVSLGHAVGMHGWQHEHWAELPDADADALATRATDYIRSATGVQPQAFRAPGGKSTAHTRQVLAQLGYTIDASHTASGNIVREPGGLTSIPYHWSGVDATHWLWNKHSADEVVAAWEAALQDADRHGGHYVFIWHPHVMGIDAARLATGERIIRSIHADPRFRIVALRELCALAD